MTDHPELIDAMADGRLVLFVGAGVSRSLGLPSWDELIRHMAGELGYHPELFRSLGDNYTLAEYYQQQKNGELGPLWSWMDTEWHSPSIDISASKVHKRVIDLDFPIIYTTNYDRWLERAYAHHNRDCHKIVDVTDIASAPIGTTQIVKYHGDFDDHSTLVLTESSYFARLDLQRPLDIKLKHDLLGRSVLFIGYSLTDIDVRFLLYQIKQMWADSDQEELRPKSYIVLERPNAVVREVLETRGIEPIEIEQQDITKGLELFLDSIIEALKKRSDQKGTGARSPNPEPKSPA